MTTRYEVAIDIEPGLKYTEETGRTDQSLAVRDCSLWQTGVAEPISGLNVLSFRQRFGAVAIGAEGIGGVETLPAFRRRGYVSKLLRNAFASIAKRVPIVFVSDGIENLYEKFGCVTCLAEAYLSVQVRNVERVADGMAVPAPWNVRGFSEADLPAMVALYNDVHRQRPWTHERHAGWNRLVATQTWQPGSEVIILERDTRMAGYAILKEPQYGHVASSLVVDECTASDVEAAHALLVEVAARCWRLRFSAFWVREPLDSPVGKAAQRLGCEYHQTFPASGGMLGLILDRQRLLRLLEPELQRRLPNDELRALHTGAFEALCRGEVIADNGVLLRLLLGYYTLADAGAYGTVLPAQYAPVAEAWFPGGGSQLLAQPYAHILDRY